MAYDSDVTLLDNTNSFQRIGWTLAGWSTASGEDNTKSYELGEELTAPNFTAADNGVYDLYAVWQINTSKLKVDLGVGADDPIATEPTVTIGGQTFSTEKEFTGNFNTELSIPNPTRDGYDFTGWTRNITNGVLLDGTYTFGASANVTDTITATWQARTFNVNLTTGEGYEVTHDPDSPVYWGGSTYVTIRLSTGYVNSPAPEATVNGTPIEATANGDGTFTYTLTDITEVKNLVIGNATRDNCYVSAAQAAGAQGILSVDPDSAVSVEYSTGVTYITVTLEDGYSESPAPEVTLASGSAEISAGEKSTVDGKTVYTYTVSNVTEDSSFTIGSATVNRYDITLIADGTGYVVTQNPSGTEVVAHGGSVTVKITLDAAYSASTAPVMELVSGAAVMPAGSKTTVDGKTVYTYVVTNVTADSVLRIGPATINSYDITYVIDGTGYSLLGTPAASVEHGGTVTVLLQLDPAYTNTPIPEITVKNAANETIGTHIDSKNVNIITYTLNNITDDVTVTIGPAVKNTYTVTIQTGLGASIKPVAEGADPYPSPYLLPETFEHGSTFTFKLADDSLDTPVYVNGTPITPDANRVYTVVMTSDIVITTSNLTYIATFLLDDGTTYYASYSVVRGSTAVCYKGDPVKADTEHHVYTFDRWVCIDPGANKDLTNMTENRVFKATYNVTHRNLDLANDETNHWYECPECDYTEGLAAHSGSGITIENYVAPTCTTKGGYDSVIYCSVCSYEMSREHVVLDYDYTNHSTTNTYSEVLYEATCSAPGMKVYYCAACDHVVRYEELPVNSNAHCWGAWVNNGDGTHSRTCAYCGEANKQTKPHVRREIYRSAPTCVTEGCIVSYCPDCGTVVTDVLEATGRHIAGDVRQENYVAPTCGTEGSYDAVRYCTVCGLEMSRTPQTVAATGVHSYTLTGCTLNGVAVDDLTEDDVTCGDVVVLTYTCRTCTDSYTETINVEHEYEWTMTAPAQGTPGTKVGTCTRCGHVITETVDFEPLGQRHVQFISQSGVSFAVANYKMDETTHVWNYDAGDALTVRGTITYYTNVDLHFFVYINSSFVYSDYDVYADGVKLTQNPDGTYTLPASDSTANISVLGTTPKPVNPGDSGTEQSGDNNGKLSFWQRIINFFKRIFSIFQR